MPPDLGPTLISQAELLRSLGGGPLSVVICGVGDGDFSRMDRFVEKTDGAATFVKLDDVEGKLPREVRGPHRVAKLAS